MSRVCFERMLAEEPGIAVKLAGREPLLLAKSGRRWLGKRTSVDLGSPGAYFSPSRTAFQADRGRGFRLIADGISA